MPTLRPRQIAGLVVIPTVDLDGGVWRVSVAFNVGASRTGGSPPAVVNREDVIVELFGPGGSLEAIASPDPGPLPTQALRGVQARGEWTFAPAADPPTELRVRLHGELGTFPLSDTFTPSGGGFTDPPKPGDDFPIGSGGGGFLAKLRRKLRPFKRRKPRCCVERFEAPLNRAKDATAKSEFFEMEADFSAAPKPCRCSCCEYRQYVRGQFLDANGDPEPFDLPSGPLDVDEYQEDGVIDEFGPGRHGYYGHRDTSTPGDEYVNDGCGYRANDTPGCPPTHSLHAEFVGLIVDLCRGTVVAVRTWAVDL
jgi:hypothetical protein